MNLRAFREGGYKECLEALKEVGAVNIEESEGSKLKAMVPSIWGWGGMGLRINISGEEDAALEFNGDIAQLGVTPLTKLMDKFLESLSLKLKNNYAYTFEYEPLTRFIPKFRMKINEKDKKVFLIITIFVFVFTLAGAFLGHSVEILLGSLAIGFGYYFGREYFYRNKD